MRQVVKEAWLEFTEPLEGGLNYLYADKLNLITTGYGNLVDPLSMAMALPWMIDGRAARPDEIATAWWTIKNDPNSAWRGHTYAKTLSALRLLPEAVHDLVYGKLRSNDAELGEAFAEFEEWPAMAQMAMHSWAWACGAHSPFPELFKALRKQDFAAAAVHIHINEDGADRIHGTADDNRGLIPRNVANKILMRNAAKVLAFKLDPDMLEWKRDLGPPDITTAPELENPASEPTICVGPIAHVDPSDYLRNRDDEDDS
ncbi:MAG TPA: hypothetical protein VFB89_06270 [Gemmatimonadales bacterium]|nr:hypothetical protein [Gemmatimonadales bacterium]